MAKLLSDNLKNIFAFSLSRLYDRSEAEDLTNDIICEVLKCARGLKNDDAFYGFMWRIAENTFKKRIRKSNFQTIEFDESFVGTYWATPEEEYLKTEELHLLRRELSLLSKQYRETTVAYYITGKSCSEISTDFGISTEMVKYYGLIIYRSEKHLQNANFRRLYINICSDGRIDGVLPLAVAEYSQKVEKARGQHGRKALQMYRMRRRRERIHHV